MLRKVVVGLFLISLSLVVSCGGASVYNTENSSGTSTNNGTPAIVDAKGNIHDLNCLKAAGNPDAVTSGECIKGNVNDTSQKQFAGKDKSYLNWYYYYYYYMNPSYLYGNNSSNYYTNYSSSIYNSGYSSLLSYLFPNYSTTPSLFGYSNYSYPSYGTSGNTSCLGYSSYGCVSGYYYYL
jgi:hypothetical protein